MRRFRFGLEPLLRLRRLREEQAEIALAVAQRRRGEELTRARELSDELTRGREGGAAGTGPLDLAALLSASERCDAIETALRRQEGRIAEAEVAVRAAAERLRECRLAREPLEQLRERRWEEYRRMMVSEEQQVLDEAAMLRFRAASDRQE
jgi:flagellar FliJ protein